MRHPKCWFREHDLERVSPEFPMVIPGAGVRIAYKPDPNGKSVACQRCKRVMPVQERH